MASLQMHYDHDKQQLVSWYDFNHKQIEDLKRPPQYNSCPEDMDSLGNGFNDTDEDLCALIDMEALNSFNNEWYCS